MAQTHPAAPLLCSQQLFAFTLQAFIPLLLLVFKEGRRNEVIRDAVTQESFQCVNAFALALMGTTTSRLSGGGRIQSPPALNSSNASLIQPVFESVMKRAPVYK